MSRREPEGYLANTLSVTQVAHTLGLSESTVRRMIAAGAIPSKRLGKHIRVEPAALDAWLAKGGAGPVSRKAAPQACEANDEAKPGEPQDTKES